MLYFLPFTENLAPFRCFNANLAMRLSFPVAFVAVSSVAGCSFGSLTDRINPYRIDIRQGNYVDQDMVAQLKRGMTQE